MLQQDVGSQVGHKDAVVTEVEANAASELESAFMDLDQFARATYTASSQIVARARIPRYGSSAVGLSDRIVAAAQNPVSAAAGVLQRNLTVAHGKRSNKQKPEHQAGQDDSSSCTGQGPRTTA